MAVCIGIFTALAQRPHFQYHHGDTGQWHDFDGEWLVLNYFAEWCAPCLREIPELNLWHDKHRSHSRVIGYTYDNLSREEASALVDKYTIAFPVIASATVKSSPFPLPQYLPMTYIINPEGRIVDQIAGEVSADMLLQRLTKHASQ